MLVYFSKLSLLLVVLSLRLVENSLIVKSSTYQPISLITSKFQERGLILYYYVYSETK